VNSSLKLVALSIVLAVAGCKKQAANKTADPAVAGSGSDGSGSGSADGSAGSGSATGSGSDAGSGSAPAAPAAFLPAKLDAKQGIVFAETRGGTVDAIGADKARTTLPDGTVVEIAEVKEADMSTSDEASVDVVVGGKTVTVPAARVLLEATLQRSPDGAFAVMSVIESCGDLCHTIHYAIASDGRRAKLGDGVADVVVAWSKDGKQAAIGSGNLWLVSLPDLAVRLVEGFTAPAYAPDGTLYVRDHDGSAYTGVESGKKKRVFKAEPLEPEEGDYGADDPPPVEFDAKGKPDFALPGPPGMPE